MRYVHMKAQTRFLDDFPDKLLGKEQAEYGCQDGRARTTPSGYALAAWGAGA